jgi:mannosyltransferase
MLRDLDRKIASQLCLVSDHTWLLIIILLAMALRLFYLGKQSLWLDEAWSFAIVAAPLKIGFENMLATGVYVPLYFLLLRPLTLIGQSETILRFPSVVFAVLSIPMMYQVGRLCLGKSAGLLGAFFLALNPFHLWYSQEARMYTMVVFFALGSIYFFLRATKENAWRLWAGLVVFSALAYGTHYFALQIALVQFAFILCRFRILYHVLRKWVICQGLAFLPLIPWLIAYFNQDVVALGIDWIKRPTLLASLQTLWAFSSNYGGSLTPIGLFLLCFVLLQGFLTHQPALRDHKLFLALWLGLPIMVTWLISQRRPIYVYRYLIVVLPAYLILLAYGVVSVSHRTLKWALTTALVAIMASSSIRIYFDPALLKQDWRGATNYVQSSAQTNDVIAVERFEDIAAFKYYYKGDLELVTVDSGRSLGEFEKSIEGYERLWLIYYRAASDLSDSNTKRWLNIHRRDTLGEKNLPGLHVVLYRLSF